MPWTRTTLPFQGAHCLANRSGPLVRLTFQIGLPSRRSEHETRRVIARLRPAGLRGGSLALRCAPSEGWCIRQDSHLQTLRSKRRMIIISPRMQKWSRWRDSHSRGAMRPAVYETAAVAAEPHRRNGLPRRSLTGVEPAYALRCFGAQPSPSAAQMAKAGGSPRCCPVLCGLRDRCIAAMLATRNRRDAKVELNHRNQACEVLADTGIRVARNGPSAVAV